METKICTECKEEKFLESYHKDVSKKDGKRSECKSCHNARIKKYRRTESGKLAAVKYRKSEKGKLSQIKYIKSSRGKLKRAEFCKTDKYKLVQTRYKKSDKGKAAIARDNCKKIFWKSNVINDLTAPETKCILFLQEYKCIYPGCDKYFDEIRPTLDHIRPVSKGGNFTKENIQALCQSCNSKKGIKTIDYRSTIHKQHINQGKQWHNHNQCK